MRAHDLWLERQGDGFVLRRGHPGAPLPIDAAKVAALRCAAPAKELREAAAFLPAEVRVAGRCAALSASYDRGYASLTPDGEKPLPKSRCPDAVKSWRSRQFAKWIDVGAAEARAPIGDLLEIVPAGDLAALKPDEPAVFRVLLEGKPAAGAAIEHRGKIVGRTDAAGEVRLRPRGTGSETIIASLRRPLASPDADQDRLEASLTFEVKR